MLNGSSSVWAHRVQNTALILLSLFFLPLDTFILALSYVGRLFYPGSIARRAAARRTPNFRPRRILVTGVGMTKGLCLARLFYEAGHEVTGADFEPHGALVCGRISASLKQFVRLQPTGYVEGLLDVIVRKKIELWVSCSGVASAVQDGEAREIIEAKTDCKAIQFDTGATRKLHEKHSFIEHTQEIGLTVPETHAVTNRAEIEEILRACPPGRKYIMKPTGMDDLARGDMTLLPMDSAVDTSKHIARLRISNQSPWILQQYIKGPEFCTHALVVQGQVMAFVACPSAELLMHYEALPPDSALSTKMLAFTKAYGTDGGADFTGHLSFDFLVEEQALQNPDDIVLYPIECNPRAHTAVALFNGTNTVADAYLTLIDSPRPSVRPKDGVIGPKRQDKYYWIGHDLVELLLLPLLSFLTCERTLFECLRDVQKLISHVIYWKDGTYEMWDPLPWWWLYHVYWPMRFLSCIWTGEKWSRINVSTTKMFAC